MREFLRKHRLEIGAPLAIICVVILTISLIFPDGDRVCQKSEHTGYESCSGNYGAVVFVFLSLARAVQDYNGLITALATAVIAWFTLNLMRATNQNASATEKAANAALKSAEIAERQFEKFEAPFLFVVDTNDSLLGKEPGLEYFLFNVGRSAAIIERVRDEIIIQEDTTTPFAFGKNVRVKAGQTIMGAGVKSLGFKVQGKILDEDVIEKIKTGALTLFHRGEISYVDIAGNEYVYAFVARFYPHLKSHCRFVAVSTRQERTKKPQTG